MLFYGDSLVLFCRVCGCRVRCRLCRRERRGQQILIAFDSLLQCLFYTALLELILADGMVIVASRLRMTIAMASPHVNFSRKSAV